MAVLPFQGGGDPLSSNGFTAVASSLNVNAPEIWTILAVETSGCGYLPDRRPQILFERHIFHKLTGGRFDDGSISDPTPGGYGPRGAPQYDRLLRAIAKDRSAALQSASWGLGQIMGMNFRSAGFDNVEQMVQAMVDSEDQQLLAMAKFLTATGLSSALKVHNWASFARGYNGPNFAINRYDVKLNGEFQKYSAAGIPDLDVRAAQLYLTYLGFHPGSVDGIAGQHTLDALAQFQSQQGSAATTVIDDQCLAQLQKATAGTQAATA
ncbi:MAG TPA: N-acetylmuramidase domain-containing protein [Candidatus Angelobacter sp.]|nr:N-acetylmuramidase domain-containing protein [Candidatus Angelobacter sp.]